MECAIFVDVALYSPSARATAEQGRVGDGRADQTRLLVDRRLRHLETQLYRNRQRRAFLHRLFGSSRSADRAFDSNEYLDERSRLRMITFRDNSSDAIVLSLHPSLEEEDVAPDDGNVGEASAENRSNGYGLPAMARSEVPSLANISEMVPVTTVPGNVSSTFVPRMVPAFTIPDHVATFADGFALDLSGERRVPAPSS